MNRTDKFWPYKLMVHLLYSKHPSIHRIDKDGKMLIQVTELAVSLGLKNDKLKEYLLTLHNELDLLKSIRVNHGNVYIEVKNP